MSRRFLMLVFVIMLFGALLAFSVNGEEAEYNKDCEIEAKGFDSYELLFDSNRKTYEEAGQGSSLTIESKYAVNGIYIEFDAVPEGWSIIDSKTGDSTECAKNSFLHEYVKLESPLKKLELDFEAGTVIADIYLFTEGELPSWVQVWDKPCNKADLMLISSHSDDEQLFFAGILPYYAIERKLNVQVVYMVQHFEAYGVREHQRPHEQLDGLWAVGVHNYPVMSDFPDVYSESLNRDVAFAQAEKAFGAVGVTYDDFCSYITECIRRFKPLVIVSHDLNGEYGHGTHVFCASALIEAISFAADEEKYPESLEKYGTWETEKTYLHLYKENPIVMDWDTTYESMGGKTPFQLSQEGFGYHKSQHYAWFYNWLYGNGSITRASQIRYYSPCQYGLYDTKVGFDSVGGDFMENVVPYSEREEEIPLEQEPPEESKETEKCSEPELKKAVIQSGDKVKKADNGRITAVIAAVLLGAAVIVLVIFFIKKTYSRKKQRRRRR